MLYCSMLSDVFIVADGPKIPGASGEVNSRWTSEDSAASMRTAGSRLHVQDAAVTQAITGSTAGRCPQPCGVMYTRCRGCGEALEGCCGAAPRNLPGVGALSAVGRRWPLGRVPTRNPGRVLVWPRPGRGCENAGVSQLTARPR